MGFRQLVVLAFGLVIASSAACSEEGAPPPLEEGVEEFKPGTLVVTSPARASMIEGDGAPVEVKGTGATKELRVNGAPAEVADDGSFRAMVKPVVGLNLVVLADGEAKVETPFLYGHFLPADKAVDQAVAMELGAQGLDAAAPAASLASIASRALSDGDLITSLKGQSFTGSVAGADWTFKVNGGRYAGVDLDLKPMEKGMHVGATVRGLQVDGRLTVKALFVTVGGDVTLSATTASLTGDASLSLQPDTGTMKVAMGAVNATLQGFRYDSDNAGFPCCVDSIVSSFLRPRVETGIENGLKTKLPEALKLTLDGIGLPKSINLTAAGVKDPVGIDTKLDGATFDASGVTFTASVLFGGRFAVGTPGEKAKGWLKTGIPFAAGPRHPSFGVSVSTDAVNQLFFAAWGTGSLSRTVPDVGPVSGLQLSPALPPVLTVADAGTLRVGLGEVLAKGKIGDKPFTAGVSILQDVAPGVDGDAIVLTPKGEPTISITWLEADDIIPAVRAIIAAAAKDQATKVLKPMRIPVPRFALDKLGASFVGQALSLGEAQLSTETDRARFAFAGNLKLVTAAAK